MGKSITMSFSAPLELSIQMEECMENTGYNRSELIKAAVLAYIKSYYEKKEDQNKIQEIYEIVSELKLMANQLQKNN